MDYQSPPGAGSPFLDHTSPSTYQGLLSSLQKVEWFVGVSAAGTVCANVQAYPTFVNSTIASVCVVIRTGEWSL